MLPLARRLVPLHLLTALLTVLLTVLLLSAAPVWAADARKVLVLYSLGADSASAWQSLIHKGLDAELASKNLTTAVGIFEERFDVIRVGEAEGVAGMEQYLRTKYARIRFDTIITENYVAARFLSERPHLFAGVPRVYLNHGRRGWQPSDGVGYEISADYQHAIGIIPRIAPTVRRIVIVGDNTARIQEMVADVRSVAAGYRNQLQFEYWDSLTYEQLYREAAALGPDSAIFLLPAYHDSRGASSRPVEVARALAAATKVPIFTNLESLVVPGVVGGFVVSAERIGRAIGSILQQLPPDIAGIPGYVFDYPTVQRLQLQHLPERVEWLNRPQSVWEQYRLQIVGGLTLIILEGVLISALVVALRGRRQSLLALDNERRQLEEHVRQRTLDLIDANSRLERLATTDPLTGIGNRRRMTEQINVELDRARRFHRPLALLMVDIDHFKEVNDQHGHEAGDRAIVAVSKALASGVRSIDLASRFGGEEFVLLMPETELEVACSAAERLRAEVAALRIEGDDGQPFSLTISIGVAQAELNSAPPDTMSSLLIRADKVLYRAKHEGRNRVICT
ncbi:MAG: diguanylate cyclase [Sphingomonadaceae bacterium]